MIDRKKIIEELLQSMYAMRHKLMVGYTEKKEMVVTPSQGCVLRFVRENKSVNVKSVATTLHITSSAATQLIDGLVQNKYLIRNDNALDRREISLELTPKAKKLLKEFKEKGMQKMIGLFETLNDKELVEYAKLNKKINENIINTCKC